MKDRIVFNVKKERPEELYVDVRDYYTSETILKYARSKSMMKIQERLTIRVLELLKIKSSGLKILDAGCGPGFVALYLKEMGYETVALDLISRFLKIYNINEINPIAADMRFLPFKSKSFDVIISISALQWIYRDINNKKEELLLKSLSESFYNTLKKKGKAIFQFYPKNSIIMEKIGKIFIENTNFKGKFIIDNPENPKKRKIFLLLKKK